MTRKTTPPPEATTLYQLSDEAQTPEPVKPARKPRTPKKVKTSADSLAQVIGGLHITLAAMSNIPELALTNEESTAVATALTETLDYYETEIPDGAGVWINLGTTLAVVYGSRYIAYKTRKQKEQDDKNKEVTE